MSLNNLEREGLIKKLPFNRKKVEDALNLARRDIETATNILENDYDWAFSIAYNVLHITLCCKL